MDVIKTVFNVQCPKNPDYKLEFLKIDNLNANQSDKNLFCCSACASQDSSFKFSNYELIQEILKQGTDQILPKWPPVEDNQLINFLIQISKGKENLKSIQFQIIKYFTELKESIMNQINNYQKQMMAILQSIPSNKSQMLIKYQQLSKIKELRSILADNKTDITEKERLCRVLIEKSITEKHKNTQQLIQLFDEYKQPIFNSGSALQIKESIMKSLNSLNILEYPSIQPMIFDFQLQKTDWNNGSSKLEITKNNNNEYETIVKKENGFNFYNVVSNKILKKDVKYIFRMKIQLIKQNDECYVGLMQASQMNSKEGQDDMLSCCLGYDDNQSICIKHDSYGSTITKQMKGDDFVLSEENEIEMRVSLNEKILEVLDYPHYHYKLGLLDKNKNNLIGMQNLILFLGIKQLNNQITLKEAFTVDQFK